MYSRFYREVKGEILLNDNEIIQALHSAADDYENGAIIEAMDVVGEIFFAISSFVIQEDERQ